MRRTAKALFVILAALLFAGGSKTGQGASLEPAEIDRAAQAKRVAVYPFKNDRIGLSEKIESKAAAVRVDGKPWFTVVTRRELEKILDEIRLQESGLTGEGKAAEAGRLLGASALIDGAVTAADVDDTHYYETRTECVDKKCKQTREYKVSCTKRRGVVSAQVKLVDISRGDIIHAETIRKTATWRHCSDGSSALPSREEILDTLAEKVADAFVSKLTPHYVYHSVELMDDPDIDYSSDEKKLLEDALDYIEHRRYRRAEQLLGKLLELTGERSGVAAYDLGVVKEIGGRLKEARALYRLADRCFGEPNELVDAALVRIERAIEAEEAAKRQLAQ